MMKNIYNNIKYYNQRLVYYVYLSFYIPTIHFISAIIALNSKNLHIFTSTYITLNILFIFAKIFLLSNLHKN